MTEDQTEEEVSHRFKLILLGPGAVGKSSLLNRFVNNAFTEAYRLTIGVDFLSKDVSIAENELAKLTIWDIGGQERFKFMRSRFYAGASGALLIFDLTRAETYSDITRWLEELRHFAVKDCVFILIGNKLDLIEDTGDVVDRAARYAVRVRAVRLEEVFVVRSPLRIGNQLVDQQLLRMSTCPKPERFDVPRIIQVVIVLDLFTFHLNSTFVLLVFDGHVVGFEVVD